MLENNNGRCTAGHGGRRTARHGGVVQLDMTGDVQLDTAGVVQLRDVLQNDIVSVFGFFFSRLRQRQITARSVASRQRMNRAWGSGYSLCSSPSIRQKDTTSPKNHIPFLFFK